MLTTPQSRTTATRPSRTAVLLWAGVVAGPVYVGVSLAQALTRPGFDLTRQGERSIFLSRAAALAGP